MTLMMIVGWVRIQIPAYQFRLVEMRFIGFLIPSGGAPIIGPVGCIESRPAFYATVRRWRGTTFLFDVNWTTKIAIKPVDGVVKGFCNYGICGIVVTGFCICLKRYPVVCRVSAGCSNCFRRGQQE